MSMEQKVGLKISDRDNVATIFTNGVMAGDTITVHGKTGKEGELAVLQDIPYGHKIALSVIHKGDCILKYGEEIGVASCDILPGEHVHIHNLESMRGRGDLAKEEGKQ